MKRLYPLFFLFLLILFLCCPTQVLCSSKDALTTWANFVLPALLPFFILNHLCLSYGAIDLMGKFLSPLTIHLLHLPPQTAYILATGYTTGAPVSSIAITKLRRDNIISKEIGNFLLPFTSNVSPLFLFSVVAAGFLNRPDLGIVLALIHYGSNFLLGFLCFRFFFKKPKIGTIQQQSPRHFPPLGKGISNSISEGIATITMIGGIMVLSFIVLDFLTFFGCFSMLNIPFIKPLFYGFIEITAGIKCTAAMNSSLWSKLPLLSGILAFGGISAMLQIATQIKGSDLSLKVYRRYKALQALVATIITFFWPFQVQTSTLSLASVNDMGCHIFVYLLFSYTTFFIFEFIILHRQRHKKLKKWRFFCR